MAESGRMVTFIVDRKPFTGFLPKYQMERGAHRAGHPRCIAVLDKPNGRRTACVSPSCSFYPDLKKHVSFKEISQ